MQEQYLTARNLFRFLSVGVGRPTANISFLSKRLNVNQSGFWWCFLSAGIPEAVMLPYFEPRRHPPRALSNLMNRTVPHSMPIKLYRAMEENLIPENLLHITAWTASALDRDMNPLSIHEAITAMEEGINQKGNDTEFAELYPFFASLRPAEQDSSLVDQNRLFLQAAFRFTMLGLHALYGDRMTESQALIRLRTCRFCEPDMLWEAMVAIVPKVNQYGFSVLLTAEALRKEARKDAQGTFQDESNPIRQLTSLAAETLPSDEVCARYHDEGTGWYVVANWLDFEIVINDTPRPTYEGASALGTVANGTLVYVLSAQGYQGLHVSSGVWGRVWWHGAIAWIPMNLLVRIEKKLSIESNADSDREQPDQESAEQKEP